MYHLFIYSPAEIAHESGQDVSPGDTEMQPEIEVHPEGEVHPEVEVNLEGEVHPDGPEQEVVIPDVAIPLFENEEIPDAIEVPQVTLMKSLGGIPGVLSSED